MVSRLERETIINFNAEESTANVWSCDPSWISKIKKLPGARPCYEGYEADVPKSWIKVAKPREMTKAQKNANAKNLAKAHAQRKKG